ncbi:MAG: HDOD domain-containing protein [Deltaproteobacteria bacterium]|nr:HDOD domain-containing protein [Deltaproteobacteria bacterium]
MNSTLENELRARVEDLRHTSTLPVIIKRLMEVMEDENSSVSDLKMVLEHDQSIVMRILSMANNIYYSFYRKVDSINTAILLLGFDMVKGIALSVGVFNSMDVHMKELWTHSYKTALAARSLAENTGLVAIESAFLGGLIHDIGKVILFHLYGDRYLKELAKDREGLLEAEERIFGATHATVGAWFASKNRFPEKLVCAIETHHDFVFIRENYAKDSFFSNLPLVIYIVNQCILNGKDLQDGEAVCLTKCRELLEDLPDVGQGICPVLAEICQKIRANDNDIEGFLHEHHNPDL